MTEHERLIPTEAEKRGKDMSEIYVSEKVTPAHMIRATATPRAIARLVGMLNLREVKDGEAPACEALDNGGAIWRLTAGIEVTLTFSGEGSAHWHVDVDDADPAGKRAGDEWAAGAHRGAGIGRRQRAHRCGCAGLRGMEMHAPLAMDQAPSPPTRARSRSGGREAGTRPDETRSPWQRGMRTRAGRHPWPNGGKASTHEHHRTHRPADA
jgi:hypothetical protein